MATQGPKIFIDYYSDPFSCWSWCNEPKVRKLQLEFGEQIEWRFVMGGLITDAESADSPITKQQLVDIAEDWQTLQKEQGMPIDSTLWQTNPPQRTILACQAYKASELQGIEVSQALLRRLREAALAECNPLNTVAAIIELAETIPGLDTTQLSRDFETPEVKKALEEDLRLTRSPLPQAEELKETADGRMRYAFPTMVIKYRDDIQVVSPNPSYDKYVRALLDLHPGLERHALPSLEALLTRYPRMATKEIEVIYQWSHRQALEQLESLFEERKIQKHPVGGDYFWFPSSLVTA
jgi:putative protein-disulfide isomerase